MRKSLLICLPALSVLAVAILPVLSDRLDVYAVHSEVAADGSLVQTARVTSVAELRHRARAPGPQARVDSPVHDFGRLDPLTTHEHVFVIRNVGDAPLGLTEGPTTCKCTLAKLHQQVVPPGEKTLVAVHWNTGRDETYAHSATIYTNDPRNRALRLAIQGQVRTLFQCTPPRLILSRVEPGATPSATAIVYSQIWTEMELEPLAPSLPGMTCVVDELDPVQQEQLRARCGRRITITLPPDLPEGYFAAHLALRGRPLGGSAETSAACELAVEGKVIRRLSVYGPEIDVHGTVDLGRVRQGSPSRVRLLLKLRDPVRDLPVTQTRTVPAFLQVRVEPHPHERSQELGLYYLHIEVPPDAPPFHLPPTQRGGIHIEFDHPRCPSLDLPVDLTVVPRDGA